MKFLVNGTALLRYTDIQHCISLRCTMCWIDTLTYCKMITTMVLANTSITSHIYYYIFVVKTFKIYSLSNFHIYNTVLSVITMLYTSDPQLIHLITGSLSVWPTFLHAISQPSQPLVTTILDCFCEFEFLDLTYRWYYTVAVFLWFITISIMPSRAFTSFPIYKMFYFNEYENLHGHQRYITQIKQQNTMIGMWWGWGKLVPTPLHPSSHTHTLIPRHPSPHQKKKMLLWETV